MKIVVERDQTSHAVMCLLCAIREVYSNSWLFRLYVMFVAAPSARVSYMKDLSMQGPLGYLVLWFAL